MEAATNTNENPSDVADSDDDLPDLIPADEPPYHLTMPGNFRGRYRNVPQGNSTGIGLYLMLEQFIISYDVTYCLPARPSVSVPPVLVEQCAACLLAGRGEWTVSVGSTWSGSLAIHHDSSVRSCRVAICLFLIILFVTI
ncbi:hypothetical protein B0H13DRAFT_1914959 [Mycena leptocephala]|nr:hypothetical protein B0H13DRAFT_1914959 [Mycena leptocephala]